MLITCGAFSPEGDLLEFPEFDRERLLVAWQQKVFTLYLAEEKIEREVVENMRSWEHSGFSVDQSVFLPAGDQAGKDQSQLTLISLLSDLANFARSGTLEQSQSDLQKTYGLDDTDFVRWKRYKFPGAELSNGGLLMEVEKRCDVTLDPRADPTGLQCHFAVAVFSASRMSFSMSSSLLSLA